MDLHFAIGTDNIHKMKSWVDVSYGVHTDSKSHIGGCISFGWGVLATKIPKTETKHEEFH